MASKCYLSADVWMGTLEVHTSNQKLDRERGGEEGGSEGGGERGRENA